MFAESTILLSAFYTLNFNAYVCGEIEEGDSNNIEVTIFVVNE